MTRKKSGGGGSFATKFLGPGDSSRPRKPPNHGQGYTLAAAGKRKRKSTKGIYGAVNRKGR